jgi:hypothetical protein
MLDSYLRYIQEEKTNYLKLYFADQLYESVLKNDRVLAKDICNEKGKRDDRECYKKELVSLLLFNLRKVESEIRMYCGRSDSLAKKYCKHIKNWPFKFKQDIMKYRKN